MHTTTPLALSRELSVQAPEAMVPCPLCAGSVKAKNLETHLRKKHAAAQADTSDERWRGVDRRMNRLIVWLPLFWAAAAGATALLDLSVVPALIGVMLGLALIGLIGLGVFKAELSFREHDVQVRRWGGLGRRTLPLPTALTVGALQVLRKAGGSPDGSYATESHHAGTYLRLEHGRRSVTVGCPTGTGVRAHWVGWAQGSATRRWDVTLTAPDFVALQYALAERGLLELRVAVEERRSCRK